MRRLISGSLPRSEARIRSTTSPHPQRLDTAGYQMIIKDDDPESPVRTKTRLLTRETHPSGSRVVLFRWPPLPPPDFCSAPSWTQRQLSSPSNFALVSSCLFSSHAAWPADGYTTWTTRNPLLPIVTTTKPHPKPQRQHQQFTGPLLLLLVPESTPSMTQSSRYKLQVPRNLKSRLWSYPPLLSGR